MLFSPVKNLVSQPNLPDDQSFIKNFPNLYRCDSDFASLQTNSPQIKKLFKEFEDLRDDKFRFISIDSRVTMLKKGWYPSIPGWHCDDFYRPDFHGQPCISRCEQEARMVHYMFQLGDCSQTLFVDQEIDLPSETELDLSAKPLYGHYNLLIESYKPKTLKIEANQIIQFSQTTLHRCSPATKDGWRVFVRATMSNTRPPVNEIRRQSQVYIPTNSISNGW
jgi:hypothetical protein